MSSFLYLSNTFWKTALRLTSDFYWAVHAIYKFKGDNTWKPKPAILPLPAARITYGTQFLKPEMKVKLRKDPKNEYDHKAIHVELEGLGLIGYVANSTYTVIGDSLSAWRLYDKIGKKGKARIVHVFSKSALCKIEV